MEAETPPLTGSDHALPLVVAGTGAAMVWFVRKPNKRAAIVAGAVVIGITAFEILLGKVKWSNARQCVARNGSAR